MLISPSGLLFFSCGILRGVDRLCIIVVVVDMVIEKFFTFKYLFAWGVFILCFYVAV
jgi:hypothetical protein